MSSGQLKNINPGRLRSDVGRYAMLPEWLLMTNVSDKAIRLFGILASKYADRDGVAYPSRARLAEDIGLATAKSIDAPMRELEKIGALAITRRHDDAGSQLTSIYTLSFAKPVKGVPAEGQAPSPESYTGGGEKTGQGGGVADGTPPVPNQTQTPVPKSTHDPDKYLTRAIEPETDAADADASVFALINPETDQNENLRTRFDRVWAIYPRSAKKKRAWARFQTIAPTDAVVDVMLAKIEQQKRTVWGAVEPRFIPHLATWLADEQWLDGEDVSPVSDKELGEALAWRGRIHMGRCPHRPPHAHDQDVDCLKTIALRQREQGTHRRSA